MLYKSLSNIKILMSIVGYRIDYFTGMCLVGWPLNESKVGVDLVLIESSLLFLRKFLLICIRTGSLT